MVTVLLRAWNSSGAKAWSMYTIRLAAEICGGSVPKTRAGVQIAAPAS